MLMFLTSMHILKEPIWKKTRWWRCCTSRPNSRTTTEHGNGGGSGIGWRHRSYVAFHTDCCTPTANCSLTCVRACVSWYFSMKSDVYPIFRAQSWYIFIWLPPDQHHQRLGCTHFTSYWHHHHHHLQHMLILLFSPCVCIFSRITHPSICFWQL